MNSDVAKVQRSIQTVEMATRVIQNNNLAATVINKNINKYVNDEAASPLNIFHHSELLKSVHFLYDSSPDGFICLLCLFLWSIFTEIIINHYNYFTYLTIKAYRPAESKHRAIYQPTKCLMLIFRK